MDAFSKLLTNNGALAIMDNKGNKYTFEMTHMGIGDDLREIAGELRICYGQFQVYTKARGLFLDLNVQPDTYRVSRIDGLMVHTWKTNYMVDDEYRSYAVGGDLILNVRDKGYIWSCLQDGQDIPTYFVTKKQRDRV
ncbi:hypothetical protein D1614_19095 [Maribellus luteus]|uniref:Uncharacterized protein n=1 Tax=Maribellus luteus TaxID=2305463 RepID=A0A399SWM4_9BACT|nr:hypothetical protein [Maribellus luteus]RIJ46313.1 hypothetical protein D1614_19095 [Maribellus luteus]